jgi:class 3 adenylate cyclase
MSSRSRAPGSAVETKGRRARTDVAIAMILAAIVSALLVGAFNYFASRSFLTNAVETQLSDIAASRTDRIERGLDTLEGIAASLALDPTIAAALTDLSGSYALTTDTLTAEQLADLTAAYQEGIEVTTPPGVEPPTIDELFPRSERAQYLQYWYLLGADPDARRDIVDPGDGSSYSEAHARHHEVLEGLARAAGLDEMLLIDSTGAVVYSVDKNIDFATSIVDGAFRDSGLTRAVRGLELAATGDAVIVDFEAYAPAGGAPTLWVTSLVRDGGEFIGAMATPIPNQALVDITTSGGNWEDAGLGTTGEVYIVGPDGLMRSESRLWLEDPDEYLTAVADAGYPSEVSDAIAALGTTVLIQPAETEPVSAALNGEVFDGSTRNYLDRRTRAHAQPVSSGSLGWVAVTEVETSEIRAPLRRYVLTLGILAIILIPAVVGIAFVLARRLLRPIDPIMAAARRIEGGDLERELPVKGSDEFADLSMQMNAFVAELRQQRASVADTEGEMTELLASVVPRRLIDQIVAGDRDITMSVRNATLVAITLRTDEDVQVGQESLAGHHAEVVAGINELAARFGAEPLSQAASDFVFATGIDSDEPEIDHAVEFALAVRDWLAHIADETGTALECAIGVAAGDIVAGVIGTDRLTFEVLGGPRRAAAALATMASAGQVLVDSAVAARVDPAWEAVREQGLVDVDGTPFDAWRIDSPSGGPSA